VATALLDARAGGGYNGSMSGSRNEESVGEQTVFFLQALGAFGLGAAVFFLARSFFDDANAFFAGGVAGGVCLLVLAYRRYGEPSGSRRNPGPDDHVLSTRERALSFVAACALFALAYACRYVLSSRGEDEALADGAWFVAGFPAFLLIWRAIWGVDQSD
jgi:hypothetical protein